MENAHVGHRERIRNRVRLEGLASFEPHEVAELLMYYTRPRGDLNPSAHEMINRFGSLDTALHADEKELCAVDGVGESTAAFLRAVGSIADRYAGLRLSERPVLLTLSALRAYCRTLFAASRQDEAWLLCLSANGHLLMTQRIERGTAREITSCALASRCAALVIVRFSPDAEPAFRADDVQLVSTLGGIFPALGLQLCDMVLLGNGRMLSMRRKGVFAALAQDSLQSNGAFSAWVDI